MFQENTLASNACRSALRKKSHAPTENKRKIEQKDEHFPEETEVFDTCFLKRLAKLHLNSKNQPKHHNVFQARFLKHITYWTF